MFLCVRTILLIQPIFSIFPYPYSELLEAFALKKYLCFLRVHLLCCLSCTCRANEISGNTRRLFPQVKEPSARMNRSDLDIAPDPVPCLLLFRQIQPETLLQPDSMRPWGTLENSGQIGMPSNLFRVKILLWLFIDIFPLKRYWSPINSWTRILESHFQMQFFLRNGEIG